MKANNGKANNGKANNGLVPTEDVVGATLVVALSPDATNDERGDHKGRPYSG